MAIKENQIVSMFYELRIKDELVDSNIEKDPIEFVYGTQQIISGLESQIEDMSEGETKELTVPAVEAYGEYDEELVQILPISDFEEIDLEIGMVLEGESDNQETVRATVIDVTKEDVSVDYNHPLAGCDLNFKVTIENIK